MAGYELDGADHSTELRYDMGFSSYPVPNEGISNGLSYNGEYDWAHGQENVYAPRPMYPMQDSLEQPHPGYMGYGSIPQPDMSGLPAPSYISPSDISFSTPLSHLPYPSHEAYYGQPYNAISPSSTGSNTSSGSNGHSSTSQKPKRKRVQTVIQRKAANVRERRRMLHLNDAFDELRKRLPAFNYEKRLSRIETLRLAMTYIAFMKDVSDGKEPDTVRLLEIQRKSEQDFPDSDSE